MSGARPFIVVGDKTDHGGEVLEGSPKALINGKMIARIGDKVHCPRLTCRGTQIVVEGDPSVIVDGKAATFHGAKTSCGAVLIASMMDNTIGGPPAPAPPTERDWTTSNHIAAGAKQTFEPLLGVNGKPVMLADTAAKPFPVTSFDRKRSGVTFVERGADIGWGTFQIFGHEFLRLDPRDPDEVIAYLEATTGKKQPDYFQQNDPKFHRNDEMQGGHEPLVLSAQPTPAAPNPKSKLYVHMNDKADEVG